MMNSETETCELSKYHENYFPEIENPQTVNCEKYFEN